MKPAWTQRCSKALTLSYDDGVESDVRLLEILRKYGVKCTFNLNSGLDHQSVWEHHGYTVRRMDLEESVPLYAGHEIAVHGKFHRHPTELDSLQLHEEYADDIARLTRLCGTAPAGMAYAYGDFNDTIVEKLTSLGLRYGRTTWQNHDFALQSDLLRFRPTCHHNDPELFDLIERFLALPDDGTPQIFYLWGHAYEFDSDHNWDILERALDRLAGRPEIFYGTNSEVLL